MEEQRPATRAGLGARSVTETILETTYEGGRETTFKRVTWAIFNAVAVTAAGGTAVRQTVTGHTLQIGRPSAGVGSVIAAVLLAWRPATAPANSRSNSNYLLPIDLETYRKLRKQIAKILVPMLQVWLYASRAEGRFEKRYPELCEILDIACHKHLWLIRRQLEPSLTELTEHRYVAAAGRAPLRSVEAESSVEPQHELLQAA